MALINCPDCNKEISDKAVSCIHCGCPITPVTSDAPSTNADSGSYTFDSSTDAPVPTDVETPARTDIDSWGPFAMKPSSTDFTIMICASAAALALAVWLWLTEGGTLLMVLGVWLAGSVIVPLVYVSILTLRRRNIDPNYGRARQLKCRRCGSENVSVQLVQSNDLHFGKSQEKMKEKTVVKPKGVVGRATFGLLGKKEVRTKGRAKGTGQGTTIHTQKTKALCNNCGNTWTVY